MRAKLESVQRQTGITPSQLEGLIELPITMQYVWMWFISLHNTRTSSGFGINPIQYSEMLSYFTMLDIKPMEWEVNALVKLDSIVLEIYAKEAEKQKPKSKSK